MDTKNIKKNIVKATDYVVKYIEGLSVDKLTRPDMDILKRALTLGFIRSDRKILSETYRFHSPRRLNEDKIKERAKEIMKEFEKDKNISKLASLLLMLRVITSEFAHQPTYIIKQRDDNTVFRIEHKKFDYEADIDMSQITEDDIQILLLSGPLKAYFDAENIDKVASIFAINEEEKNAIMENINDDSICTIFTGDTNFSLVVDHSAVSNGHPMVSIHYPIESSMDKFVEVLALAYKVECFNYSAINILVEFNTDARKKASREVGRVLKTHFAKRITELKDVAIMEFYKMLYVASMGNINPNYASYNMPKTLDSYPAIKGEMKEVLSTNADKHIAELVMGSIDGYEPTTFTTNIALQMFDDISDILMELETIKSLSERKKRYYILEAYRYVLKRLGYKIIVSGDCVSLVGKETKVPACPEIYSDAVSVWQLSPYMIFDIVESLSAMNNFEAYVKHNFRRSMKPHIEFVKTVLSENK